jgi:hypothetical protein
LQTIDEDYERSVQVEQVHAQDAIDHLAKVSTADENHRGREVVEAIRRVSETHNHLNGRVMRERHALDLLLQRNKKTCNELRAEIHVLSSKLREREIERKMDDLKVVAKLRKTEFEARARERMESLRKRIAEQAILDAESLGQIESQMHSEVTVHAQKVEPFRSERFKIESECDQHISQIHPEFERQRAKLIREHIAIVNHMKAKIDAANHERETLFAKMQADFGTLRQRAESDLQAKAEENAKNNSELFATVRTKSNQLSDDIATFSKSVLDLELRSTAPEQRDIERKAIETLLTRLQSIDELTRSTFGSILVSIHAASEQSPEPEVSTPPSSRSGRVLSSSSSGGFRVVMPSDSRLKKKRYATPSVFF